MFYKIRQTAKSEELKRIRRVWNIIQTIINIMTTQQIKDRIKADRGAILRDSQKAQGFFDGRFRKRVIIDKRKQKEKYLCREAICF